MDFRKNDFVTVKIEDIGSEGEGIGKIDGFAVFVKDAIVGDTVEARIVKCMKNYAYGRLEKVVEPSPFRVEPKCICHRQCGGCQLQALAYEEQLAFKQGKIRNHLIRIGGFEPEYVDAHMEPIIGMEEPFRYRNKAQYPIGTDREGNVIAGFYAGRTHNIIANKNCWLGVEENEAVLDCILDYMRKNRVSAYDETTGKGLVRHVLIRKGFTSGEIMVCLVINLEGTHKKSALKKYFSGQEGGGESVVPIAPALKQFQRKQEEKVNRESVLSAASAAVQFVPRLDELIDNLVKIDGMTSVSVSINTERTNVIMGKEIYTLWGKNTISDTIHVRNMKQPGYPFTGDVLDFHISPLSFYQVNPVQTEKLYSLVLEYASLTGHEVVWDLYCGIGTISLFLARSAGRVCGVEVVPQAIEDARENAARNGITNAEFYVGKAEDVLKGFMQGTGEKERYADGEIGGRGNRNDKGSIDGKNGGRGKREERNLPLPDVIVVDPPRKGCDEACLDVMLRLRPDRIVYVSCDSATLARDLKVLCEDGYEIQRVRGVDQFGQTVHVETVCLLSNTQRPKKESYITLDVEMEDYYRIKNEGKNSNTGK